MAETLHQLTPRTEDSCQESHIILDPPYHEDGKDYTTFRIFQRMDKMYVTDEDDQGITLALTEIHTETCEVIMNVKKSAPDKASTYTMELFEVKNNLPSIVRATRIPRFPDSIFFKDYTDLDCTSN